MVTQGGGSPWNDAVNLSELTPAIVNQAVDIYLRHAYDSPDRREAKRPDFSPDLSVDALLGNFRDETAPHADAHRSYVLQLGSEEYPHMKLGLWEAYYQDEFIFAVDCHDGFRFDESGPDYREWLQVKDRNRQRKHFIECALYEAGLSTLRRLKEETMSRTDCIREFQGREVLLVDDDADSSAIVSMLLRQKGIHCHWVTTVREVREYVAAEDCRCGMALIDVILKDGNGMEVVRALRAEPRTQDLPVVFVSALNGSDVQGLGVANYLRRPFSARELIETVTTTLQEQFDGHETFRER